jgi:transcription elongation factor GreA
MATSKKVLVTKEGLAKLEAELHELKTVRRKQVADRLAEAISYGDLSENSEYDEAKNEQAFVEGRILELEEQIKFAEIIEGKVNDGSVQIGSKVTLEQDGKKTEYVIVGATEADALSHKISNESPVGQSILGRKVKETVEVKAPGGTYKYKIVKVG